MGPQGVPGPVGITFQGAYSSAANYALADGVSYNGSGYVSLVASNHGNTPDQSPQQWALFAAAGAGGATGPAGATGATGAMGAPGPQGVSGPMGATGATGPQGPPVANYLGNYQSTMNYALNDAVSWQGSTYISLLAGNRGNTPSLSSQQWAVLAAQGTPGVDGTAGTMGPMGPAGPVGMTGAAGPQGPPVSFQGGWLIGTQYAGGDAVGYGGASYIALGANVGRQPDSSPTYWGLVAAAGAAGPAGATGATGMQGPMGYSGQAGPVGPQGPACPAGADGKDGGPGIAWKGSYSSTTNYVLADGVEFQGAGYISLVGGNIGIPPGSDPTAWSLFAAAGATGAAGAIGPQGSPGSTGLTGAQGLPGPEGAAGINFRGPWTGVTGYLVNDAVTWSGSTFLAVQGNNGQQPDASPQFWTVLAQAGGAGPTGPTGSAATVTIGSVTTVAAGTPAAVSNSGTSSAAVLDFSIPQGAAGAPGGGGGGGGGGTSGIPFVSMYHLTAYTSYFSVNSPASSTTESAAVLTWVPTGCTATALNVYSLQAYPITVTLRVGANSRVYGVHSADLFVGGDRRDVQSVWQRQRSCRQFR